MGTIVSSWSEVTLIYPELDKLPAVSSSAVNTTPVIEANRAALIQRAESQVHGRLAQTYSVPFSNNNYTAKDLVFDMLFTQHVQSRQVIKGKTVRDFMEEKIKALNDGAIQMVDVNGTVCQAPVGNAAWSNTMNYHPTFGVGAPEVTAVDSQELIDQNNARGDPLEEAL